MALLENELQYYLDHQEEIVRKHNGKCVVIKDSAVIGVDDDASSAVNKTVEKHELGTFLVQRVSPGTRDYTATFQSRASFE